MKILPAVAALLICLAFSQLSFAQDAADRADPDPASLMQDTTISRDPSFVVRNVYAVKDSLRALYIRASRMQDTTIALDPAFVVMPVYAEKDSLAAVGDGPLSKRDSLVKAIKDSLNAIGSALMHTADMQDTTIALDPSFIVGNVYAMKDSLTAIRDSIRASLIQASQMQDTTILLESSFVVTNAYITKDSLRTVMDSLARDRALAASMQDTIIALEPSFVVMNAYVTKDRLEAVRDSIARPTIMQDTVIAIDPSFLVRDLYPVKDSLDAIRDSVTAMTDSLYADSVRTHWAGWKKYEVQPQRSFTLSSNSVLKGKTKAELQYNIADFYLYLNGDPVMPPTSGLNFFAAGCLGFKYDDTLLLNSGLGSRVGVGVGIKIFQGRFTSTLHANTHNTLVYKMSSDDSVYVASIIATPVTQSLILKYYPDGSRNEILIGEYQATYNSFYQKNDDDQDEVRRYTVRIIFRCRVSGGINSN
jgi:hypothetical protein